jgi:deoxyribodipyrimidine photo-lyase
MPPQYERGLFLFHRDLRIQDNVGLQMAATKCKHLYTAFIFTPEQVGKGNPYKSNNAVQFMIESLAELQESLDSHSGELILLYGKTTPLIRSLLDTLNVDALFFNRDYTPYAIKRDKELEELCQKEGVGFETASDYYLHEPGTIMSSQGKVYHKFTPYYDAVLHIPVAKSVIMHKYRFAKPEGKIEDTIALSKIMPPSHKNENIAISGGRSRGLQKLYLAVSKQRNYAEDRNTLEKETTRLSAYLKFGCISIREVFHSIRDAFGLNHEIIRQLIWRDFFAQLLYAHPETLGHSYNLHFEKIRWKTNARWLQLWKEGKTGFPIVDACMRQLNTTGYMHNRGRMIVASFLVKTLLLDWREGERHFAQNLIDYDVASNFGNWSAIVGGGAYSMPYFRVMNPWIQSASFDKDATYIKSWVPELKDVAAKDIHKWNTACVKYRGLYPCPLVDYQEQKEKALELYREYL